MHSVEAILVTLEQFLYDCCLCSELFSGFVQLVLIDMLRLTTIKPPQTSDLYY